MGERKILQGANEERKIG